MRDKHALNSEDYKRLEASQRAVVESLRRVRALGKGTQEAIDSHVRTLNKLERKNQSGKYAAEAAER
jgi:hypothetical protein